MIFARFNGPVKKDENLQIGGLYVGKFPLEDSGVVSSPQDGLNLIDDSGLVMDIGKDNRFEYPEKICAVVVKPFDGKTYGEVVEIAGNYSEDMYQVIASTENKTEGSMVHQKHFLVLDHTNVEVGTEVFRQVNHRWAVWKPILAITNDLKIRISQESGFQDLIKFKLAVLDGDILTRPIVTCVKSHTDELTAGEHYYLQEYEIQEEGCVAVLVTNDRAEQKYYQSDYFTGVFIPKDL